MILVLLGTNPYSFERLARAIDELAVGLGGDVFIQTGNTPYHPRHCRWAPFVPRDAILRMVKDCELLITQGGAGSIHDGLAAGKTVIAVPRRPEFHESTDRQEELVRALEAEGRILAVHDVAELPSAVARARDFRPAAAKPNQIPEIIRTFLSRT